jgi:hypothetical protein
MMGNSIGLTFVAPRHARSELASKCKLPIRLH